MPPNAQQPAGNPKLVPWILYGALFASTGLYLFVLYSQGPALAEIEPVASMLPAMGGAALMCVVASYLLPRYLHRATLGTLKLETDEVADPNASVMLRDEAPKIRVFADPENAERRARAVFFTPFIVRLALAEAVAIFGFVLGMQGFDWTHVLPFFGVCWAIFAVSAPLERRILGPVEEALGARFPA